MTVAIIPVGRERRWHLPSGATLVLESSGLFRSPCLDLTFFAHGPATFVVLLWPDHGDAAAYHVAADVMAGLVPVGVLLDRLEEVTRPDLAPNIAAARQARGKGRRAGPWKG